MKCQILVTDIICEAYMDEKSREAILHSRDFRPNPIQIDTHLKLQCNGFSAQNELVCSLNLLGDMSKDCNQHDSFLSF